MHEGMPPLPISARQPLRALVIMAALMFAFVPITYGTIRAFPIWDDAGLSLVLTEKGVDALLASYRARPLVGYLMYSLAETHRFVGAVAIVHFATWLTTGWIAVSLWRMFFPNVARYALLCGLLTLSPILCETHLVLANPTISGQLGPVLVYLALLLIHSFRSRSTAAVACATAVSMTLVVLGVLLSEYGLATLLAAEVLFVAAPWIARDPSRRRRTIAIGMGLALAGVAAYVVYHGTAVADVRLVVRPEYQLRAQGLRRLVELPLRLPFAIWRATLGELLGKIGAVDLKVRSSAALAFGSIMAAVVFSALRWTDHGTSPNVSGEQPRNPFVVLIVAMLAALFPIVVMKTSPRGGALSRLWMPILPIASCSTIYIFLVIFQKRARLLSLAALAFVAGFTSMDATVASIRTRDTIAQEGEAVRRQLAPTGITVALYTDYTGFSLGEDPIPEPAELIMRMTSGWTSSERQRFWASVYSSVSAADAIPAAGRLGACSDRYGEISYRAFYGVGVRSGPIAKVLWLSHPASGQLLIIPAAAPVR